MAPPITYHHHVPMPTIRHIGDPPILDKLNYPIWVFEMKSYLQSSSNQLWRIIEQGYHPYDPNNLTPREEVDYQLNSCAL